MNPSPSYHPPPSLVGTSPFTPSPPLSQSNLGVIGEPSARHHGIEPKGEFLLQLLQGGGRVGQHNSTGDRVGEWPSSLEELPHSLGVEGGGRVGQHNSTGDRVGEWPSSLEELPHSLGVEDFSTWQIRDPAVAALGPSHPFHAVEPPNQLLQPNPLFMPPQYASLRGGGAWSSQQQLGQQQHQFFPPSIDHRDFGGLHPRGPHQVALSQFPAYPLAQALEQATHRVDNSILDFSRRPDAPWLPPPNVRQGINDSPQNAHTWGGSMQGSVLKTPLPPPLPPLPTPPPQQFFGNGKELLQLLLGGGSQNLGTHKLQKSPVKNAQGVVIDAGSAEDIIGEGLTGGAQVVLPRTQVHGPIGPPKRVEASQPEQYPAGAEYLLGKLWAAPNATAKWSPESSRILKPGLTLGQEDRSRDISHGGIHMKESLTSLFEASEVQQQQQQRTYDYFAEQSKPIVKKPSGFTTEQDQLSGLPLESTIFSSPVKVLPQKGDVLGGRDGALLGTWDGFQERPSDIKSEHPLRPTDDKAFHQIQRHSTSLNGPARNREESYQAMSITTGSVKDNMATTDFSGTSKENETSISREYARMGGRGSGRRGASGRGEIGRSGGRMVTGQWVAVQDVQKERDSARDVITTRSLLDTVDVPADRGASYLMKMNSTGSVSTPPAGKSPPPRKEDSPTSLKDAGSGGKSKEDSKRRRGQTQEWRMKQPSPPQSKSSETLATLDSPSQQHMHSAGILPLASQVDHPGLPSNMVQHSVPGSAMDESTQELHHRLYEGVRNGGRERSERYSIDIQGNVRPAWEEDFIREFSYAKLLDESDQLSVTPPHHTSLAACVAREEAESEGRHENLRDSREVRRPHQQQRTIPSSVTRGDVQRPDLATFTPQLLTIYKGLIPSHEEVQKRRKFLGHLDSLVSRDWAGAKLFLFGSCANDFGVCNSDIDICLSVDDEQSTKAELVMKMAGILRSANMQNVQALTHARVPIVKFTDPDSGINCDICVNNMLAVVNSKLLHDYSQVDPRLRQLAFLVKHWAKQRQVNETYRGTLSSYAYVLMCIHFLQQRKPAILPCLQDMPPTYQVIVGKIKCAYYDKVEELKDFGARNKEPVGELLTAFFDYWAFRHDYNHCVISVRTGGYLSKDEKDWTRRIGNERHLICIEDPFEVTHDLGRVVDRHSIRVLRDEFSRAARILRQDPNPATALFEPFIREKVQ